MIRELKTIEITYLTSNDNLEGLLSNCINDKWMVFADKRRLRINFISPELNAIRTVRLESLKNLSEQLRKTIY